MQYPLTPGSAGEIYLCRDSDAAGSVSRFVVTLTMCVRRPLLEQAVNELMSRFPQFAAGVSKNGDGYAMFPLTGKVPVFEGRGDLPDKYSVLGSPELGGYLFRVSCSWKTLFFDWHLSICDERGMAEFVKAVVFRYIQICGYSVSNDGTVKTSDSPSNMAEGVDPYERLEDIPASRPVWYMDAKAFVCPETSAGSRIFQIRIPVSKVKGAARQYLSQPEAFISPLYSHSLYERYSGKMEQGEYIVAGIRENLRPHFPAASLRAFFAPVTLAYNRKVGEYPFNTIFMSQKKLLDAQLKTDALAYSAKRFVGSEGRGQSTFSVCNIGNVVMPETLQQYILEFYPVMPSVQYADSLSVVNFKGDMVITLSCRSGDRAVPERFAELLNMQDIYAFISDEYGFSPLKYSPENVGPMI